MGQQGSEKAYLSEIFASAQGEGAYAGQRHLFVRFAGCNVRCRYCDTPDALVRTADCTVDWPDGRRERLPNPVSAARLASIVSHWCARDPTVAMIALTGGEPMVQHAFLEEFLRDHRLQRPCLLETNALVSDGLERIVERLRVVSADVKLPSANGGTSHREEHRSFFARCDGAELYAKIVVDERTPAEEVAAAAALLRDCAPRAKLFLQPMTDLRTDRWGISEAGLLRLAAVAARDGQVWVRPQLHKMIGVR